MNGGLMTHTEDFDLRDMIRSIASLWYWIVIAIIVCITAAVLINLYLPDKYRSSASILITTPDSVFSFDERISSQVETPQEEVIPELALSDSILAEVLKDAQSKGADFEKPTIGYLRNLVEISTSSTVLTLSVTAENPEDAALIANIWADIVIGRLNAYYLPTLQASITFQELATQSLEGWQVAQNVLVDFHRNNPERIVERKLADQERHFSILLDLRRQLDLVLRDGEMMKARLEKKSLSADTDLRDDLNVLYLSFRSLAMTNDQLVNNLPPLSSVEEQITLPANTSIYLGGDTFPVNLQILASEGNLFSEDIQSQITFLNNMIEVIQSEIEAIEGDLESPQVQILELQTQLIALREQRARLEQDRDLGHEAYQSLARKAQETRLSFQENDAVALLASEAVPVLEPTSPGTITIILAGGVLGGLLGIAVVLAYSWWQEPGE